MFGKRSVFLFLILAALLFAMAPAAAQDATTLVVTSNSDINHLDPAKGYDTGSWAVNSLIYRGLVGYDTDGVTIIPTLAEKWDASPDGLKFTFTLRDGVKFSNGRAITADDVKYSFERLLSPAAASPGTFIYDLIVGATDYMAGTATEVSGIKVIDARTIEFDLSRPEWTFVQRMTLPFASIVAKEDVEAAGDQFDRQPLGAGPYVLTSWQAGLALDFERNPNYYREGYPKIDKVHIDIGLAPEVSVLRIEQGQADTSLDFVSQADYPRISGDATLKDRLIVWPVPNVQYMAYNTRAAPFNNADVRKALSMAIDRDRIVQILNGRPLAADGLFPPNLQGNNPDSPPLTRDVEGAKALLKAAGYPDGFTTTIYSDTDSQDLTVVQAIIQDWADVGVQATNQALEFSQLLDVMYGDDPGQMPVLYIGWYADYADPSDFYQPLLQCNAANNTGGFCNENLDKMEAAAAALPPGDDRWKAYGALEAAINEDMPWIFVYYGRNFFYTSARIHDLYPHPTASLNFETANFG